jgi:phosphate transport system permease protein
VAPTTATLRAAEDAEEFRFRAVVKRPFADRVYRAFARSAGLMTLTIMALIGSFLFVRALPALRDAGPRFLTETQWLPDGHEFGIAAVFLLTVEIAVVALMIAVPVAIGASLFITDYGLWGRYFLQPRLIKVSNWLTDHLGFIPIFKTTSPNLGNSTFIAGVVVSLMVLPICAAVMREVFSQAPPGEKEGALALGATRWGMIWMVVLPFGRGGIVGGSMLGLGRALGETIAVALIISPIFNPSLRVLDGGGNSISALIALRFSEATPLGISALMAAGLALFVITLIVNAIAAVIVARSRSGAATEI